jgi:hypothetical protein
VTNPTSPSATSDEQTAQLVRRHLAFGWIGLTVGAVAGLTLEVLHAFKAPIYLNVDAATARLMWRLGHAHLGVLSLMSLAFAFTMTQVSSDWRVPSRWLLFGSVCLPLGFLLAGFGAKGGDPGFGIVLVPPGAIGVVIGCVHAAIRVLRGGRTG